MRIVFMGTPDFAVPTLDALVVAGHEVACVYTQPPRPANRGKRETPSPVHARSEALGIEVRHPARLRDPAEQAAFAALEGKMAALETKMLEQERTIRQTLTMLIEWIEADDAGRVAA